VRLITSTPSAGYTDSGSFEVLRCVSKKVFRKCLKECDAFLQIGISLHGILPLLTLRRRPVWLISHQTWTRPFRGNSEWFSLRSWIKVLLARYAQNVYCSEAVAKHINIPGSVIGNPYDDRTFKRFTNIKKDKSLVFAGRLVSDKGVDVLLHAMAELRDEGVHPDLTIIGDGPELGTLKALSEQLKLQDKVSFIGVLRGQVLANELNKHSIMVVPSRWREPFGITALEGIACGCCVVASSQGGLPEAVGPCGLTFNNGDSRQLADCLSTLIRDPIKCRAFDNASPQHLARFTSATIAKAYIEIISQISMQRKVAKN